jgi:uncharacterized membrane protein YfcA
VTTPVGVSGAVFLLPIQMSVLGVPNPQLTPTNLVFNVVSGPGGLLRYARRRQVDRALALQLIAGSVPGVVLGALLRVYVVDDPEVFRLLAVAVLVPTGLLILRPPAPGSLHRQLRSRTVVALAFVVGTIGGIYGIGGGSILAPALVGLGFSVAEVAPAALASTFFTSIVGVLTYAIISLRHSGSIAPDWTVGIAIGIGGLLGGYVGTGLRDRVPEAALRRTLGIVAMLLAVRYLTLAIT